MISRSYYIIIRIFSTNSPSRAQSQKTKEVRETQIAQEEELAREMAKLRAQEMQDSKLRQQIRETSHEIRELEGKLKAGYMNKERAAQLAEKEARRQEEKVYFYLFSNTCSVFYPETVNIIRYRLLFLKHHNKTAHTRQNYVDYIPLLKLR